MQFTKFNTITLVREDRVEEIDRMRLCFGDSRCAVTEKVHGANLTVGTDGDTTYLARRNGVLQEFEDFYGIQYIEPILRERIEEMFMDIQETSKVAWEAHDAVLEKDGIARTPELPRDIHTVEIVGEFCGGHYPHPDVPELKKDSGQVGKGKIWYGQEKTFMAFELRINGKPQDFYQMGAICRSYNIPIVPVLYFGTFDECLAYSQKHINGDTVVPFMMPKLNADGTTIEPLEHLPPIEGNTREGHVIFPIEPQWFPNGKRMLVKHKSAKAAEKVHKKVTRLIEFNEHQQVVFDEIMSAITEARLESVLSKELEPKAKDFPRIIGMVVQDAIEDTWCGGFNTFAYHYDQLNTKQHKQVNKRLNREAALRLRTAYFAK